MKVRIDVSGLAEAAASLAAAGARVEQQAGRLVQTTALNIANRAKQAAPVDTGFLRGSILASGNGTEATIGAYAHYAVYVEYGTYKMAAQPFMNPSWEAEIPQLEGKLQELLGEL